MHLFFLKVCYKIQLQNSSTRQAVQLTIVPLQRIQFSHRIHPICQTLLLLQVCFLFSPLQVSLLWDLSIPQLTAHRSPDCVCQPPTTETIVTNTASQVMHKIKYGYGHLNDKKKKYLSVRFSFRNYHPQRVQGMIKDRQGYLHHMKHLVPL